MTTKKDPDVLDRERRDRLRVGDPHPISQPPPPMTKQQIIDSSVPNDEATWLGKLVRIHLNRLNVPLLRVEHAHFAPNGKKEIAKTDDEIRADLVKHAASFGFASGDIVKVTMCSRFGDCGVTKKLDAQLGYDFRLRPDMLELLSEQETATVMRDWNAGRLHPHMPRGNDKPRAPEPPVFVTDDPNVISLSGPTRRR